MSAAFCPHCGAMLSEDFLRIAGDQFDCPECDQPIGLSDLRLEGEQGGAREELPLAAFAEEQVPGGRVRCRSGAGRLLIHIPPGSNRNVRSLGCFAVLWLAITAAVSGAMLVVIIANAGGALFSLLFLIPFMGIFWTVGLVMLYFWVRGRFGKTSVLLEADRLVWELELFRRRKLREYALTGAGRAELVEAYRQNDQPVYKVSVSTAAGPAGFGTFLAPEEKQWLVDRINRHLAECRAATGSPSEAAT